MTILGARGLTWQYPALRYLAAGGLVAMTCALPLTTGRASPGIPLPPAAGPGCGFAAAPMALGRVPALPGEIKPARIKVANIKAGGIKVGRPKATGMKTAEAKPPARRQARRAAPAPAMPMAEDPVAEEPPAHARHAFYTCAARPLVSLPAGHGWLAVGPVRRI